MIRASFLAVAACAALAACSPQRSEQEDVPTGPTDPSPAAAPAASANAILTSAVETGVDGVRLIHDRKTGCQYFGTVVGGNIGGLTDLQPRYQNSTTLRCVTVNNAPPTPLFVPTEPFGSGETGADSITILLDRETNCQYFLTSVGGGTGGVTSLRPRLNADGSVFCTGA